VPQEPFKTNYDASEEFALRGDLLNRQAAVLNAIAGEQPSGYSQVLHSSISKGNTIPPPWQQGIALITDASETCASDTKFKGSRLAPCAESNLYVAKFRWFSHTNQQWEESIEPLSLDASAFWEPTTTDASQSPTTGVGFGAIPKFVQGDLVTAYWDEQRGWLVPIYFPPQDTPTTELASTNNEALAQDTDAPSNVNIVEVYLEVLEAAAGAVWEIREKLSFRIPTTNEGNWFDSRSGFARIAAPSTASSGKTRVRLRALKTVSYDVTLFEKRISFFGIGRLSSSNTHLGSQVSAYEGGEFLKAGWAVDSSVEGRFRDSPTVVEVSDESGWFEVQYEDVLDSWIIGVEFSVNIGNVDEASSVSSTSSSSAGFCECVVVCDLVCTDGLVDEVCYCTISFPKIPSLDCDAHCGTVTCVSCGTDLSTASSTSTLSSLSSSSTSSPSTSTSLSTLSTVSTSTSQSTLSTLSTLSTTSVSSWSSSSYSSPSTRSSLSTISSSSTSTMSTRSSWSSPSSLSLSSGGDGPSASFDGTACLERTVAGFQAAASDAGAVVIWFKSSFTVGEDDVATLFAANNGDTPRIEMGFFERDGDALWYIEADDGSQIGTTIFTSPGNDIDDGNWHMVAFTTDGFEFKLYFDGEPQPDVTLDPDINDGRWFKSIQDVGGSFTNVSVGCFNHGGGVRDQFYIGEIDDIFVLGKQPTDEEIKRLYESQAHIDEIENEFPDIYDDIDFAWELSNEGSKQITDEYVAPTVGYFTNLNTTSSNEGIRGILQIAADMQEHASTGLVVTDAAVFDHSGALTIVTWVRFDDASAAADEFVWSKSNNGVEYALYRDSATDKMVFRIFDVAQKEAESTSSTSNDRFYFVVCRVDWEWGGVGPPGHMQVIVGDSLGTALQYGGKITVNDPVRKTASDLEFGMADDANHMDGAIDDVLLFHDMLSNQEIENLYKGVQSDGDGMSIAMIFDQYPALWSRIVGHWPMNENSGTRSDDKGTAHAAVAAGKADPDSRPGNIVD